MSRYSDLGNALYTGERSIPVVPQRKLFYLGSAVLLVVAVLGLLIPKLNLGMEFTGGSEFRVSGAANTSDFETKAREAVGGEGRTVNSTLLGTGTVRVQTERLTGTESESARSSLASSFGVTSTQVSATFIGPSWGASVSRQALSALLWFLALVAIVMALYFRTWKMSLAALIALVHDLVITAGIYAWTGFEVSPATMIGFLTVLGYSLYDTVVVFDKVRENTAEAFANGRLSFADAANLAVNQTMVRSINTTVVAILPVLAILIIGVVKLGAGTLLDLSLVLFVGIIVGAYSSIFIATPLLVSLRSSEEGVAELAKKAERHQARVAKAARQAEAVPVSAGHVGSETVSGDDSPVVATGEGQTLTGRAVHKYAASGPRNQPKRTPKSRR
ncbi:MAG: protein translocase subunit SecF [Tetrasphaera sp.]|nr:protein translocase subunit SecF [Tetrasphaera sp.]